MIESMSGVFDLPDLGTLVLLCVAALCAGWIDAVSGGGGLIQLPALLLVLPPSATLAALGTNKLSSIVGTSAAAVTYNRNAVSDLPTAVPMAASAFVGSAVGAVLASWVPADTFRLVVFVVLVCVWVYTLLRPAFGATEQLRWHGRRRHYATAIALGGVIGVYDGAFGPGTGSFLVFVLVGLLGYAFLRASAVAKIVNVGTNLAALIVFAIGGHVLWALGAVMAVANLVGGVVGARTAIARGSPFVRVVFLAVVAVLILRLGWSLR